MAKKLCANIEMFTLNQNIFLVDEHHTTHMAAVPMDRVGEIMSSLISEKDGIDEIELNGNQDFIQKIGYDVLEKLKIFHSDINVRIKLNGKVFN